MSQKEKMKADTLFKIINYTALVVTLAAEIPLFAAGYSTQAWAIVLAHLMLVVGILVGMVLGFRHGDEWHQKREEREAKFRARTGFLP